MRWYWAWSTASLSPQYCSANGNGSEKPLLIIRLIVLVNFIKSWLNLDLVFQICQQNDHFIFDKRLVSNIANNFLINSEDCLFAELLTYFKLRKMCGLQYENNRKFKSVNALYGIVSNFGLCCKIIASAVRGYIKPTSRSL